MQSSRPICILCWIAGVTLAAMMCLATHSAHGEESLPPGLKVVSIHARPQSIELSTRFQYRQLLLIGKLDNGQSVDVTRMASVKSAGKIAEISKTGLVSPRANGQEELVFEYAGHQTTVAVQVAGLEKKHEVSFVRDVQPAFSRMGCNAGTCHGSQDGKNGFKLSLRGYDPLFDYRAFTDDISARRFNRAAPDQSLMLLKSTGSIPHVGGVRTQVGERYYEMLRQWIADGVKFDAATAPRVTGIEIYPHNPIVPRAEMKQQIAVQATYSDGSRRDVTRDAFIESGNIEVIEANEGGLLTMLRRGESPVLVRYEGAYAATTLMVMGDRSDFAWKQPPTYNYIDQRVYDKLQRVKILPSDVCTDAEFIRRVFLDLTGLPPTSKQVRSFLVDSRDSKLKRDELVDHLVGNREYVEHWTNKWADLLQVNRKFLGEEGAITLRNWIKASVATNKPYDQFAREVITATGSNIENPPAAYWKILRDPTVAMENTTHLFLAVRFNCNKCHDHPFERWTQDQYYRLAQYFAQVGRKEDPAFAGKKIGGSAVEGAKPLVEVVFDTGSGSVKHDRTGEITAAAFPYEHADAADSAASRRQQLARWITSPENQYFAKSYANRLWGYLFGIGIIEPIDDIRAGNPATNPELLDALTADFVRSGFDVQHMLRTICKSRTYQHSFRTNSWNQDDEINYSHSLPRRLPAEVLYDAIHLCAGASLRIPGVPAGFRAAQLPDVGVKAPFLDDFGRPVRESACECERTSGIVLGPIMKLINGPTVANALADPQNALSKLVAQQPDDRKLVEEVYLRFFGQPPTAGQIALGLEALQAPGQDHEQVVAALKRYEQDVLPAKQQAWERQASTPVEWMTLKPTSMTSSAGAAFAHQEDQSILVSGNRAKDIYTIVAETDLTSVTAIRLEALADPRLPAGGPGRADNGNFVLNELRLSIAPKSDGGKSKPVALQNGAADFSQSGWDVRGAADGNDEGSGWAVSPQFNKTHTAIFETVEDTGGAGGCILTFHLVHKFDPTHSLGRFRFSVTSAPRPISLKRLPVELTQILAIPKDKRTAAQVKRVADHYRSLDTELARLQADVQRSENEVKNRRLIGTQDLAWALINNPAFLFNR